MPTGSLRKKALKGVGWSTAEAILDKGVTFIIGIILARILSPTEYGIIGMAMVVIVILDSIADSGLSQAVIRKKHVTDDDLNTMFISHLVASVLIYLVVYLCAPFIAMFFKMDTLTTIVRVLGVQIIIHALTYVQATQLTRKIDFKSKAIAALTSSLLGGVVGIICAYNDFGVWALVILRMIHVMCYSCMLWFMNKWLPSWTFSVSSFKEMWNFGWKMMLARLLDSTWKELYQIIVGKFYTPATLGQYSRARQYARIFSSNITTIVQRVTYPVMAQIQDEKQRLTTNYRKIIKLTMFITTMTLLPMGAVAEPLIYCLIGEKWHEAATYLPLICISMSLYPLHAINLNMIKVNGRSDIFLILEIIKKCIAVIPLSVGALVSIRWMLIASIFTGFISYLLNSYYSGKSLGYSSWMQLKDVAPSYGLSLLICVAVYFFKYLPISNFIILPIQIIVGLALGFILCETMQQEEYVEIKSIVINEYKSRKNKQ